MNDEYFVKLHKDRDNMTDFCKKHKRIYLYGTGEVADRVFLYLYEEKVKVEGFVVSPGHKNVDKHMGVSVYEIDQIDRDGVGIIVSVRESLQDEVAKTIKEYNFDNNSVLFQKIYFTLQDEEISPDDAYIGVGGDGSYFDAYKELDEIGISTGTDKNSLKHDYLRKYEFFLKQFKDEKIDILELGVFNGESLKMWETYFDNAQIIGVDIDEKCRKYRDDRIEIEICDLAYSENLKMLGEKYKPTIIIEDASHLWSHQIKAFVELFPCMKSGGIYIMEDIGTSFGKYRRSEYSDSICSGIEFMSVLSDLVAGKEVVNNKVIGELLEKELICLSDTIDMISFLFGSVIVVKK